MSDTDRTQEFLELLTSHDRALGVYVYSMVPQAHDADDILQQTKMILWRCFDQFEAGTNFLAWARKTAFHQVLTHRRKKKRQHVGVSDEVLELLGEAVADLLAEPSARHEALKDCLARLPEGHRQLIDLRYFKEMEIGDLATQVGRTEVAVYRALSRVRVALMECVSRKMEVMS